MSLDPGAIETGLAKKEVTSLVNPSQGFARAFRALSALAVVAVCVWPLAVHAQANAGPPESAGPLRTVDQVRAAFSDSGYQVDQAYSWDWLLPPATSFQVHDPRGERVLLVITYSSAVAADAARLQAQTHELAINGGSRTDAVSDPHLVLGYGTGVWNGNVAVVQSTRNKLALLSRLEADRNNGIQVDEGLLAAATAPSIGVDADFRQALETSVATL